MHQTFLYLPREVWLIILGAVVGGYGLICIGVWIERSLQAASLRACQKHWQSDVKPRIDRYAADERPTVQIMTPLLADDTYQDDPWAASLDFPPPTPIIGVQYAPDPTPTLAFEAYDADADTLEFLAQKAVEHQAYLKSLHEQ